MKKIGKLFNSLQQRIVDYFASLLQGIVDYLNRPPTYHRRPQLRRIVAATALSIASLFVLTVVLFFVMRGFMVYHDDGTGVFYWNDDPSYYVEPVVEDEYLIRPPVNIFNYFSKQIDASVNIQISKASSFVSGYTSWTIQFLSVDESYLGFSMEIELPSEWTIELMPQRGLFGTKSLLMITDNNRNGIGAIAHDTYPDDYNNDLTFDTENEVYDLMPIYKVLATGSEHQVYVRSPEYSPIAVTENGAVAVSVADYRWRESEDSLWRYYSGKVILAHDNLLSVYTIVEFYDDLLSESEVKDIAVKVKLTLL